MRVRVCGRTDLQMLCDLGPPFGLDHWSPDCLKANLLCLNKMFPMKIRTVSDKRVEYISFTKLLYNSRTVQFK